MQAELEEELAEDIQISVTIKYVIAKPTIGVETKLLLVPELIQAPGGKVAENEATEEVVDDNQTGLDQPVVFRSSVHDVTRVIPAKLVVERKTRIPGNVMFGLHETEFEVPENYLSQGRPPRSHGRVLLQRRFAISG